jgi:hypothetical protein
MILQRLMARRLVTAISQHLHPLWHTARCLCSTHRRARRAARDARRVQPRRHCARHRRVAATDRPACCGSQPLPKLLGRRRGCSISRGSFRAQHERVGPPPWGADGARVPPVRGGGGIHRGSARRWRQGGRVSGVVEEGAQGAAGRTKGDARVALGLPQLRLVPRCVPAVSGLVSVQLPLHSLLCTWPPLCVAMLE